MIPIEKRDLVLIAPTEQRGLALPICIERKYLVLTITIKKGSSPDWSCTIEEASLAYPYRTEI